MSSQPSPDPSYALMGPTLDVASMLDDGLYNPSPSLLAAPVGIIPDAAPQAQPATVPASEPAADLGSAEVSALREGMLFRAADLAAALESAKAVYGESLPSSTRAREVPARGVWGAVGKRMFEVRVPEAPRPPAVPEPEPAPIDPVLVSRAVVALTKVHVTLDPVSPVVTELAEPAASNPEVAEAIAAQIAQELTPAQIQVPASSLDQAAADIAAAIADELPPVSTTDAPVEVAAGDYAAALAEIAAASDGSTTVPTVAPVAGATPDSPQVDVDALRALLVPLAQAAPAILADPLPQVAVDPELLSQIKPLSSIAPATGGAPAEEAGDARVSPQATSRKRAPRSRPAKTPIRLDITPVSGGDAVLDAVLGEEKP